MTAFVLSTGDSGVKMGMGLCSFSFCPKLERLVLGIVLVARGQHGLEILR